MYKFQTNVLLYLHLYLWYKVNVVVDNNNNNKKMAGKVLFYHYRNVTTICEKNL